MSVQSSPFSAAKVPRWLHALRLLPPALPGKTRLARWLLKRAGLQGPVDIQVGDLKFRVPSSEEPVAFHLIADGLYDERTCAVLQHALRHDSVLLDVGANVGAIAITAAHQWCPGGRVVGIEASPAVFRYLEGNLNANPVRGMTVLHRAVSNRTGEMLSFYDAPDEKFGMGSLANRFGGEETKVRTITLDDAMESLGIKHVDVIKVDVEGFELQVFEGGMRLLRQKPAPLIVFEFNDWAEGRADGSLAGSAQRFLRAEGYSTLPIAEFLQGGRTEGPVITEGSCDFVAFKKTPS